MKSQLTKKEHCIFCKGRLSEEKRITAEISMTTQERIEDIIDLCARPDVDQEFWRSILKVKLEALVLSAKIDEWEKIK